MSNMTAYRCVAWAAFIALFAVLPARADDEALLAKAKDAVSRDMLDPEAARFRDLRIYKKPPTDEDPDGMSLVCGEVNGKNAYGAYTGYSRFFWYEGGSVMRKTDFTAAPEEYDRLFELLCKDTP